MQLSGFYNYFVRLCKICEHGGFLQSRSHICTYSTAISIKCVRLKYVDTVYACTYMYEHYENMESFHRAGHTCNVYYTHAGKFGVVYKGWYTNNKSTIEVAIKTMKGCSY